MNADTPLHDILAEIDARAPALPPREVLSQTGTTRLDPYVAPTSAMAPSTEVDPDKLFGASQGYFKYKKEKPEHRRMLWFRLEGYNVKETAQLTGYTPQTVSQVCKQPWFVEAFCALSKERGQDAISTFLEGQVLPALQQTVELSTSAESEAVRLAACTQLLDRYLGKSVAKTEIKSDAKVDVTVYDAAKLQEEFIRNQQTLASRGFTSN